MSSFLHGLFSFTSWEKVWEVVLAAIFVCGRMFFRKADQTNDAVVSPKRATSLCGVLILLIVWFAVIYASDHPDARWHHKGGPDTYFLLAITGIAYLREKI